MAMTVTQLENCRKSFEQGIEPKEVAKKLNENPHRISSLARLMGFSFIKTERNPMDWWVIKNSTRQFIAFTPRTLHITDPIRQYRVKEVNEKTKEIIIEYKI
jgi:hypothetical protein